MFVKCEHINDFVLIYKILGYKNILQIEYSYFTEQEGVSKLIHPLYSSFTLSTT